MFEDINSAIRKTSNLILHIFKNLSLTPTPSDWKFKISNDHDLVIGKRALTAEDANLDPRYSYFILHASFGDKWCILSFMREFLIIQKNTRILASKKDEELIRIFLGTELTINSIIQLEESDINFISSIITPVSLSSMYIWQNTSLVTQTEAITAGGFPKNAIRHLHLVKYPYFSDLHLIHGISYATCIRMILSMPSDSVPSQPIFYTEKDKKEAEKLINNVKNRHAKKIILFNAYNISHQSLDEDKLYCVIKVFEKHNIQVIVNVSGHPAPDKIQIILDQTKMSVKITAPGHLLAIISNQCDAVVGVIGGAMNVAVQFTSSHILSFYKNGIGYDFPLNKLFGGHYSDNIWRLYDKDWPSFMDHRVIKFIDFSNTSSLTSENLTLEVENFIHEINKH